MISRRLSYGNVPFVAVQQQSDGMVSILDNVVCDDDLYIRARRLYVYIYTNVSLPPQWPILEQLCVCVCV